MAKQVFENTDLVRRIYSFGDPSHRRFTETLTWDLRSWPEVLYERYQDRRMSMGYLNYNFTDYLDEVSSPKIQRLMKSFLRCYCCARHNHLKNYVYGNPPMIVWREQAVFEHDPEDTNCECKCRSLGRICTKHLYYREIYEE